MTLQHDGCFILLGFITEKRELIGNTFAALSPFSGNPTNTGVAAMSETLPMSFECTYNIIMGKDLVEVSLSVLFAGGLGGESETVVKKCETD